MLKDKLLACAAISAICVVDVTVSMRGDDHQGAFGNGKSEEFKAVKANAGISCVKQDVGNNSRKRETVKIDDLNKYVDIDLIIPGHEQDVVAILAANTRKARILKILYECCKAEEITTELLLMSGMEGAGSKYLISHRNVIHPDVEEVVRAYDKLICNLGLNEHMKALELDLEEINEYDEPQDGFSNFDVLNNQTGTYVNGTSNEIFDWPY